MATVHWNPGPLRTKLVGAFRPATVGVQVTARKRAPKGETGELANSIILMPGVQSAVIRATADHAVPVIKGSGSHEIEPVKAQAVVTPYGVFARVQHPGNAPNDFMQEAANQLTTLYISAARRAI